MNVPFLDINRQHQTIKKELDAQISKVIESGFFIGGTYVKEFESQIAAYLGVKYALGCGNGTDALILALRASNIRPGDEIITSPFTFFATAEAIASVGATPVFVDICEEDYNINSDKIEEKITSRTRAILPVHIFGAPCNMDKITELAEQYNLIVIEDAAQAIGSTYKGRKAGSLGTIGCFSFYPTKNLGSIGDGGMITTNNDDLAIVVKALREHGAGNIGAQAWRILNKNILPDTSLSETTTGLYDPHKYFNYLIGSNSRLDALQAAVLLTKLSHLDEYNAARTAIAKIYNQELSHKVTLPQYDTTIVPCWHQYVVCTQYKYQLCSYLQKNGVGCGTFYPVPLHLQKAFSYLNYHPGSLPVAEKISAQSVCLPIFPELTQTEIAYVIEIVKDFFDNHIQN